MSRTRSWSSSISSAEPIEDREVAVDDRDRPGRRAGSPVPFFRCALDADPHRPDRSQIALRAVDAQQEARRRGRSRSRRSGPRRDSSSANRTMWTMSSNVSTFARWLRSTMSSAISGWRPRASAIGRTCSADGSMRVDPEPACRVRRGSPAQRRDIGRVSVVPGRAPGDDPDVGLRQRAVVGRRSSLPSGSGPPRDRRATGGAVGRQHTRAPAEGEARRDRDERDDAGGDEQPDEDR